MGLRKRHPDRLPPDQEGDRPIQGPSIYELNPDQLRAEIAEIDKRENKIQISMAYQQHILRDTTPENPNFEEVMYKESHLFRALGLQGKRKSELQQLLRTAEGS
jgi:hypothetical protein